jgi:glycosyltransferase involved in cell wall biosynthesis
MMTRAKEQPPWVIISGGFHWLGGMDRANAALARFLCDRDGPVHLVGYRFDAEFERHPAVTLHRAAKPAGSFYLGQRELNRLGRSVAGEAAARNPDARVLVNGGNCAWPGINWMHCVHHAWNPCDRGAPLWFRIKNRLDKSRARRDERRCAAIANHLVANSEQTRRYIIERLGAAPERVTTVYFGADHDWRPSTPSRRAACRAGLDRPLDKPLIAFVGALGHDSNKGFDTLWRAWSRLCARPEWDADLIVAGGGRALPRWRAEIARAGLADRVVMLGFTDRVADVLAASDLLISPVRYESYGLNAHEALCRGVPAIVTQSAGIAERFAGAARELLLREAEDADELATLMLRWRADVEGFKRRIEPLARTLRARTWDDMAADIVALAENNGPRDRSGAGMDARPRFFIPAHNRESTFAN